MFNLKRLFGRKEQLNDAETAYIEGRASEAEAEQVWRRTAASPERLADLESLRATVHVLRSVQSEMAPRSFTLAEAPAYARSSRRTGFAPAMAAIVAVIGVGLLSIGDLTGYVDQSGMSAEDGSGMTANEVTSSWQQGGLEDPPAQEGSQELERDLGAQFSAGTPSPAATATIAPASGIPDSGYGISPAQLERLQATATASAGEDSADGGREVTVSPNDDDPTRHVEPDEREPARAPETTGGQAAESTLAANGDNGVTLPLWQLQVSLAGLAAVMIAAWAYLRRRATA